MAASAASVPIQYAAIFEADTGSVISELGDEVAANVCRKIAGKSEVLGGKTISASGRTYHVHGTSSHILFIVSEGTTAAMNSQLSSLLQELSRTPRVDLASFLVSVMAGHFIHRRAADRKLGVVVCSVMGDVKAGLPSLVRSVCPQCAARGSLSAE